MLECLASGHFVWNCSLNCKCITCSPKSMNKHTSALHELFSKTSSEFRAAPTASKNAVISENVKPNQSISCKMVPKSGEILLCTRAVIVINPTTGESKLAYVQHDTAAGATLIRKG